MIIFISVLILLTAIVVSIAYYKLVREAKRVVQAAPRVPMHLCDKHGAYPAKYTIKIKVPMEGAPDLVVEKCIFCYDEAMKEAEKVFKV